MEIEKLRKLYPGQEVTESGTQSTGIMNNKSFLYGDLLSVSTKENNLNLNFIFVNSKTNLYFPQLDDIVIGKIVHKMMDYYKLDLGQSNVGYLPALNFPNVTKRNKPELNIGEYVSGNIIKLGEEYVIYCSEGLGKVNGVVFDIPVWKVRKLFISDDLQKIGKEYKFDIGLGMNGKIYIDAEDPAIILKIYEKIAAID